ncbi:SRPBCC family protein [Paracrocinitomix mangrovi]|uniref:SRPBCC family protein n=1 Tax=Paracrocinitomix mangrovi TaxID=2862509 RepID=UPI001C8ED7D9|nr:SRPBCC family protein [Paracrocinitomix mangrovi]UKN01351.1 SRPBCC family protein [Paracrocinitomix mangrovi]
MKYSHEIVIELPREKVVELFNNQENAFKWMKGLDKWDHLSGNPGETGAKSKMVFKSKRGEMTIEEEITRMELPDVINFVFTSKGVKNWNDNRFDIISDNQTRWTQNNVFKFKGMVWVVSILMPKAFKKQSLANMHDFKSFAEGAEKS